MKTKNYFMGAIAIAIVLTIASCKKNGTDEINPQTSSTNPSSVTNANERCYHVVINPADFVSGINNPYFPLLPGDSSISQNTSVDSGVTTVEDIYVTVTHTTKVILGVTCIEVHDVAKISGMLLEDTRDWYAQDIHGNVWYFGESTMKLVNGVWVTEGSFEAGVNGAQPGIIMWGDPASKIGITYRQEYYAGHAEDKAKVVSLHHTITVPYGTFTNCIKIRESNPLDPGVVGVKYYAPGIGEIKKVGIQGGNEQEVLINVYH